MPLIPFNEFIVFVKTLHGEEILTRAGRSKFTVEVVGEDLHFTPLSTGKPRQHTRSYAERVLQHFGETGSWANTDYKFTVNSAYQLTLIGRYLETSLEDRRALKMDIHDDHDEELEELQEDEATQQESLNDAGQDLGLEKRKIFTDKSDPPVGALHMRWKAGDLVLDPLFQRRKVWDDTRSSKLVESMILEVPLPLFYLAEGTDGKEEVIDGQQASMPSFASWITIIH